MIINLITIPNFFTKIISHLIAASSMWYRICTLISMNFIDIAWLWCFVCQIVKDEVIFEDRKYNTITNYGGDTVERFLYE